jgi:hypothetical protein
MVGSEDVNGGRLFAPRKNLTRVTTTLEVSSEKGEFEKEGEFKKSLFKKGNERFGCQWALAAARDILYGFW